MPLLKARRSPIRRNIRGACWSRAMSDSIRGTSLKAVLAVSSSGAVVAAWVNAYSGPLPKDRRAIWDKTVSLGAGHDAPKVYEVTVPANRTIKLPTRTVSVVRAVRHRAGWNMGRRWISPRPVIAVKLTRNARSTSSRDAFGWRELLVGPHGSRARASPHSPVTRYVPGGGPTTLMPYCAAVLERGWTAGSLRSGSCVRSGTLSPAWR